MKHTKRDRDKEEAPLLLEAFARQPKHTAGNSRRSMDNRLIVWAAAYVDMYGATGSPVRATQHATEVVEGLYASAPAVIATCGKTSDEAWSLAAIFGLTPQDMLPADQELPQETGIAPVVARVRAGCDHTEPFIARAQLARKWWCDAHKKTELMFWNELILCLEDRHENGDETLRRLAYGFHAAVGVHKGTTPEELIELTYCAVRAASKLLDQARFTLLREGRR